jgi:hypothetical protein
VARLGPQIEFVTHQATIEAHPFACDAVQVGRFQQLAAVAIGADGLVREVVGEDEEDIRPGLVLRLSSGRQHHRKPTGKQCAHATGEAVHKQSSTGADFDG